MASSEESKFFPTEELKRASEERPIKCTIGDDGKDSDPLWDLVARELWPSSNEKISDREALSQKLMLAIYSNSSSRATAEAQILLARLASKLMGNRWMKDWEERRFLPRQPLPSMRIFSKPFWSI